ncbi:MAG TPA: hypothetical protein VGI40_00470 [Pirellulaceae bacterium]|jgi:hypothetical protein
MRQISSQMTFFYKRIFPTIWFGFLMIFVVSALIGMVAQRKLMLPFILVPTAMATFGYFLMKQIVWCLADEVFDNGQYLLVRKGRLEERVALSNIMNLSFSPHMNPKRITLTLREPSNLGREIAFSPPMHFSLNPFAKSPLVDELIERIDAAKTQQITSAIL